MASGRVFPSCTTSAPRGPSDRIRSSSSLRVDKNHLVQILMNGTHWNVHGFYIDTNCVDVARDVAKGWMRNDE